MNKKILSIFALIMALSFAVSCSNEESTGTGGNNNNTKKDFATFTANNGSSQDATQEDNAVAINVGTTITSALGAEKSGDLTLNITGAKDDTSFSASKVTYTVTKVEEATATDPTDEEDNVDQLKAADLTANGTKLTIANGTTLASSTDFTGTSKFDLKKVTITAKCEGYNDKDIVVFVKISGAA